MKKNVMLIMFLSAIVSCTHGVKSYLYNNSPGMIVLSGCDDEISIEVGKSASFIACDNLMVKTALLEYRYADFVPPSVNLNQLKDYAGFSAGNFVLYFHFNEDGKVYVSKKDNIPQDHYDSQPTGFPVVGELVK